MNHLEKQVDYNDRDEIIDSVRLMLNGLGFGLNYQHADLVHRAISTLANKGYGDTTIKDMVAMRNTWSEDWKTHFELKKVIVNDS